MLDKDIYYFIIISKKLGRQEAFLILVLNNSDATNISIAKYDMFE